MESLPPTHRGVTLIEMLVVLSIIGILTIIVVISQGTFNRTILLNYTAYDVALTIRSAQTYGLGSRLHKDSASNVGYGVHFTTATPTSFLLFADAHRATGHPTECHPVRKDADPNVPSPDAVPGDCAYREGFDPRVAPYTLGNGMRIKSLYTYSSGNGSKASVPTLDVVFSRPNTKTYVASGPAADAFYGGLSRACIELESPQQGSASIQVQSTGQISVTPTPCPTTM